MKRLGTLGGWRIVIPPLGDAIIVYACLYFALSLRHAALVPGPVFRLTAIHFTPLFIIWLTAIYALGLYELRVMRDFVSLVRNILVSCAFSLLAGGSFFYSVAHWTEFTPKTHLLLTAILSHSLFLAWRRIWLGMLDFHLLNQHVTFLGDHNQVAALQDAVRQRAPEMGFEPVEWQWPGTDFVVADGQWVDAHWDEARGVFLDAVSRGVPVMGLETFYELLFGKVSPQYAGRPSWVTEHVLPRASAFYPKVKRLVDSVVAGALLALLGPLLLAIAAAIRVADGAPVLYHQKRVGFLGREFLLWKFRTMIVSAEDSGPFTSAKEGDRRVTALGAYLRRFRLDELPQLWNVLAGDMSLVGPRPEWTKEVEILEQAVTHYHLRHLVPPGVTGWAQVYFRATNNTTDSLEKLHYDLYYVKYASLPLDVSILLKTIKRVFMRDAQMGAENPSPIPVTPVPQSRWTSDLGSFIRR